MKVEIAMKILEKVKVKFLLWSFLEQHFHPYPPPTAPPCLELSNESLNLREILMESESWVLEDHIHPHPQLLISSLSITHKALLTSNSTFFFTILWSMGCGSKVRMRALLLFLHTRLWYSNPDNDNGSARWADFSPNLIIFKYISKSMEHRC